jgi:uncharacterized protein (TIGR03790 family)
MTRRLSFSAFLAFLVFLFAPIARADLRSDELLLIVNANEPQSRPLADFYAEARLVPRDQICTLNLPTTDQIPFEVYEHQVLAPVRAFLRDHNLQDKIRCLVTFYGMPLRLQNRAPSPQEKQEVRQDNAELEVLSRYLVGPVQQIEAAATQANPNFRPRFNAREGGVQSLRQRFAMAGAVVQFAAESDENPARRDQWVAALRSAGAAANVPASQVLAAAQGTPSANHSATAPATTQSASATTAPDRAQILGLLQNYFDPADRRRVRQLMRDGSAFTYALLLEGQVQCLATLDTQSSLDNELALLWQTQYPRTHFLVNPLFSRGGPSGITDPIMVCRLDAPKPEQVRQIILDSLRVERDGLNGRVVIDARGMRPRNPDGSPNGYFACDQSLRDLAALLRAKTKLDVFLDDKPEVIGPHQQTNVAVYVGWHSPGNYIPSCVFVHGAVGMHIASFEMTSLHQLNNHGWCPGMINDGIAATIGPVAEPYLSAFPPAMDFFPLLLSGKMTLAETYWYSTPLVSWMMTLVGDPLYRPFAKNPPLAVQDLPPRVRVLVSQ